MTYRAPGVPLRVYYYNILPFSWRGQVENVMLLMEDVTEQIRLGEEVVKAQRHLAGIVESAWDIILSTDSAGIVLTWNTAAERLTGYSTREVCGSIFFDLFHAGKSAGNTSGSSRMFMIKVNRKSVNGTL